MAEFSAKLSLFPVSEKKNEKGPDQTGAIEIPQSEIAALRDYLMSAETVEDWQGNPIVKLSISTWINEMKDGRKYLKGSVQPPYKAPAETSAPATTAEIPF
jgi:hypothetical protein